MHLPGETQPTVITRVFFEEQEGQVSRLPQLVEAALRPEEHPTDQVGKVLEKVIVLICFFFKNNVKLFVPPCKVLKQMGGRDSVHYLWTRLQDAVDIKLDWNIAGRIKLSIFSFQLKLLFFHWESPFSENFIGFLDESFYSPIWIFTQRPDNIFHL